MSLVERKGRKSLIGMYYLRHFDTTINGLANLKIVYNKNYDEGVKFYYFFQIIKFNKDFETNISNEPQIVKRKINTKDEYKKKIKEEEKKNTDKSEETNK